MTSTLQESNHHKHGTRSPANIRFYVISVGVAKVVLECATKASDHQDHR